MWYTVKGLGREGGEIGRDGNGNRGLNRWGGFRGAKGRGKNVGG